MTLLLVSCLALLATQGALAAPDYCHDPVRDLVTRTLPGECKGTVISEQKANSLREQRRQRILGSKGTSDLRGIRAYGTGLIVGTGGQVLTSLHTITGCRSLNLLDTKGQMSPSRLLGQDQGRDLALITSDFRGEGVALFDPEPLGTGDIVTISGYPFRGMIPMQPTAMRAEVPALDAPDGQLPVSATIRRGHSGSPVLDEAGRVRGIIRAKVDTPKIFAMTGEIVKDIGIAVPASEVLSFLGKFGLPRSSSDRWGVSIVRVDCR